MIVISDVKARRRCQAIEECFQTAKNETGLDHRQVHRYQTWYRHVTLSMIAAAFLIITRDTAKKGADDKPEPTLMPLTINEIRKPFKPYHRAHPPRPRPHPALVTLATN